MVDKTESLVSICLKCFTLPEKMFAVDCSLVENRIKAGKTTPSWTEILTAGQMYLELDIYTDSWTYILTAGQMYS